ncbi:uncharacterized protein RCH25_025879 [Pelodytes ibericus]
MTYSMDNSLLSQFVNGVSGPEPPSQSKLYSSWSVCEDEAPSVPEFTDKSSPFTVCESGNRLDMFRLVSSVPEESSKLEPVTDWDSLSKLFPPLWTSNIDEQRELSEYLPSSLPDQDPQSYREHLRTLPDMESLQRGFEDLGLLDSFVSHTDPQLDDLLQDVYIENPTLKLNSVFQPNKESPQYIGDYIKFDCADYETNGAGYGTQSQKRAKEFSGFPKPMWKGDKGRGKFIKSNPAMQHGFSPSSGDGWSKENYVKAGDCALLGIKQQIPQYNQQYSKEQGFQPLTQRKLYDEGSENRFCNFPNVGPFEGRENQSRQSPNEGFVKPPEFNSSGNATYHNENLHPSWYGYRWFDSEVLGTQKQTSPLPSPASSSLSDGSPTHHPLPQQPYFSRVSPLPGSLNDGQRNITANNMTFPGFIEEKTRCGKPFGHSSPSKDGLYGKSTFGFQAPKSPPQQNSIHNSERYRLPKKNNLQNNCNSDRRGRRHWNGQQGPLRQNPQQYNMFQRKQEPNLGNVSDFINASFLPSPFSLMSDLKQNQNFPSFNPQTFSPPVNMPFPPPRFPFSDLVDLLHYEDLNPFISDLFCGELPAPYAAFPTPFNRYRPPRNRSGPANELHIQLEECCEQLRALEKERKKTEADLARHFPCNRVSSSYSSAVPRLPTNPSRVDRLVVDELREQARAVSLVNIMEWICSSSLHVNISLALEHHLEAIHLTQARRKDEIVNAANRQKQGTPRFNNEKDVLALAAAIKEMVASTRKARTALWCALQMTLPKSPSGSAVTQEDLERALQELCPGKTPKLDPQSCVDLENVNKGRDEKLF